MACLHPAGTITDHTVQGFQGADVRYAWRGICLTCQKGVVGMTALPSGLEPERLKDLLTNELMTYFGRVAAVPVP